MTLKELSIELGKPTHVLANTLRQVGLADSLLADNDTLNDPQIHRLRLPKKQTQADTSRTAKGACCTDGSIGALAEKLARPIADMLNIVKMSHLADDKDLAPETILERDVIEKITDNLLKRGIRIYKLADELGLDRKELAEKLCEMGIVSNANWKQKLDDEIAQMIRERILNHNRQDKTVNGKIQELNDPQDEIDYPETEDSDELDSETDSDYGIGDYGSLADMIGVPFDRLKHILNNFNFASDFDKDTQADDFIWDRLKSDYEVLNSTRYCENVFEEIYLKPKFDKWAAATVENRNTMFLTPGTIVSGTVTNIDNVRRVVTVNLKYEPISLFWFGGTKYADVEVSFDEWDWEIGDDFIPTKAKIGDTERFFILSHPIKLSRRLAMSSPEPKSTAEPAKLVGDFPDYKLKVYRSNSGVYGYITYLDTLGIADQTLNNCMVVAKKNFKRDFNGKTFHFAQFGLSDTEMIDTHLSYINDLIGLSEVDTEKTVEISDWEDFVNAYENDQLILAKITDTNNGGYLMTALEGNDDFELFCPFSKAPKVPKTSTWISPSVTDCLIGSKWIVKIESDPEDEENNNTVVSANLSKEELFECVEMGAYYDAIVCNINDYGANLLVGGMIPVFLPNSNVSWTKGATANSELELGQKIIVKLLKDNKNDKWFIASARDAMIDPWNRVSDKYPMHTVVEAKVVRQESKGILLSIGDYDGFLPASEISWVEKIEDCSSINLPDSLRVVVTGYNEYKKNIILSLRKLTPDPWTELDKHLPENGILKAKVAKLTKGGVWLKVGELGFKGYLSFRDVDWCRYVDKDSFPYSIDEVVEVKITKRNVERRVLICSIKALKANPWKQLDGEAQVDGLVTAVYPEYSKVRLACGIECECRESMEVECEGQSLNFDILHVDPAAQQITISYRKKEIVEINTMAVGEMFKEYRSLSSDDKQLMPEGDSDDKIYRDFTIKDVSSTGRVIAVYAEDDDEYENGILLPGNINCKGCPVNVIFARHIIKQFLTSGQTMTFQVTHRYEDINYAVLSIDIEELLDLDNITTDDMVKLTSNKGVEALVLADLCTPRNIFVQWNGYFGYIPMQEYGLIEGDLPYTVRVKTATLPRHPEQMIHFTVVDEEEIQEAKEVQGLIAEKAELLDEDLLDCYRVINNLDGFNPQMPEYYPYALQIRYDPERHSGLSEFIASDPTYFSSQTFFLDCRTDKQGNGYLVSIFNKDISINAFSCYIEEYADEIRVTSFKLDIESTPSRVHHYGKPIKISGENIHIIPLNSSAPTPGQQDIDILLSLLKYNREVLPELRRLTHGYQAKRGEHYLTLQELLKMDLEREEILCSQNKILQSPAIKEIAGIYGGSGFEFEADPNAFDAIICKDDSDEGTRVMVKPNDGEQFNDRNSAKGIVRYIGQGRWVVYLYKNQDLDIEDVRKLGLDVKRTPNLRHIKRQIIAIDNFVYERNGLDIFSKIERKKLKPVIEPDIHEIESNPHFDLSNPNDPQACALKMALGGSQLTLIQGPPGTGKSTVIVDIVRNLVKQHKKVLVCTQSVAPVEELYFKLSGRRDGKLVGDPVKVYGKQLRCAYLRDDESIEISGSVEERRKALKDMMLLLKSLRDVNINSDEESVNALNKAKDAFENKSYSQKMVFKYNKEIHAVNEDVLDILSEYHSALDKKDVENFASEHNTLNLDAVDVVFGTCIGVGVSTILRDLHFDTLIIDEAGKANYAESLVPMMMADEFILVGDDKQLPPYTNSELVNQLALRRLSEIEDGPENDITEVPTLDSIKAEIMNDVGKSLFGDLKPRLPEANCIMLTKQFRMHPEIGDFVSKLFYNGDVQSMPRATERQINIKGLENPIMFINTSGMGVEARECRQGKSLYNDGEIQAIEEELLPMLEQAIDTGKSIGILSPYGAQVERLVKKFPHLSNHIFTIDSIQGEEYDIVVFSFVRNTKGGSLNFIDDLHRLNVAFSRAKCNLIMVGHLDTLLNESLHKIDRDEVMAIYNEISSKKVKLIVHRGAMQSMYDDYPPEKCPLIQDLDHPYHMFENCKPVSKRKGEFTSKYNGKVLTFYNPAWEKLPLSDRPESFSASLIGYVDEKPFTMFEPMAYWLTNGCTLKKFEFRAIIHSVKTDGCILALSDKSLMTLRVPFSICARLVVGMKVKVCVRNKKFTIKPVDNE